MSKDQVLLSDGSRARTGADRREMYRRMWVIRRFEQEAARLYRDTAIPGFVHLSVGQEASAVGACWPLRASDSITSTHRGHGHGLAKGMDVNAMMAELMGKASGTCRGRGGSMHIADPAAGVFGANGIVGAGLPIANGVATADRIGGGDGVTVAFFGDGAVAQGAFHEAVNLAAAWTLPVVFFCENNGYSEFTPAGRFDRAGLRSRAAGYGVPYVAVDGNDVEAVAEAMTAVVEARRSAPQPCIVEATTYRRHGHYEGDPQRYRSVDEAQDWVERDPLAVLRARLEDEVGAAEVDRIESEVETQIARAIALAEAAEPPDPATVVEYVSAPRPVITEQALPTTGTFRLMDAVREAVEVELAADPRTFLAGVDVAEGGNVFGLFRGLVDRFGDQVRDVPISESALVGLGVGSAMAGARPIVEIMYLDFIGVCFDQILNQAAKLRYMTGGAVELPLVIRTQFGAGRSSGSQHSQSLEAMLAHIPGISVVMPSTPADAYGLLRASIQDPNPVVFIENRLQYGRKGPRPDRDHLVPLGRARVVRPGRDVTVVSYSRMVEEACAAAEEVAAEGVEAEVIDLRTIAPLDRETVLTSLAKTHRMLIAHEAVQDFGVGAELSALAAAEGFWYLDEPVVRVAAQVTPAPYAPSLEQAWLPGRRDIAGALRRMTGHMR